MLKKLFLALVLTANITAKEETAEESRAMSDLMNLKREKLIKKVLNKEATPRDYEECLKQIKTSVEKLDTNLTDLRFLTLELLNKFFALKIDLEKLRKEVQKAAKACHEKCSKEYKIYSELANTAPLDLELKSMQHLKEIASAAKNFIHGYLFNIFEQAYQVDQLSLEAKLNYRQAYERYQAQPYKNYDDLIRLRLATLFLLANIEGAKFFNQSQVELNQKLFDESDWLYKKTFK